jgi:hypothetical protein
VVVKLVRRLRRELDASRVRLCLDAGGLRHQAVGADHVSGAVGERAVVEHERVDQRAGARRHERHADAVAGHAAAAPVVADGELAGAVLGGRQRTAALRVAVGAERLDDGEAEVLGRVEERGEGALAPAALHASDELLLLGLALHAVLDEHEDRLPTWRAWLNSSSVGLRPCSVM